MYGAELTDDKKLEMQQFRRTKLLQYVKLAEALRNDFIAERKLDGLRSLYKKRIQNIEALMN